MSHKEVYDILLMRVRDDTLQKWKNWLLRPKRLCNIRKYGFKGNE